MATMAGATPVGVLSSMLFAAAMVHLPTGSVLYSVDNSDPSQLNLGARESQDDSGSIPRVSEQADAAGTSSSRSRASSAAEGRSDASSASVFDGEGSGGLRPSPPASQRLRSGSMDGRLSTSRLQAARRTRRSLKSSRGNAKSRAQLPETTKRVPHISAVVRTVCTMVKMNLCMGSARFHNTDESPEADRILRQSLSIILPNAWRVIVLPHESQLSQLATVLLVRAESELGTRHAEGIWRAEIRRAVAALESQLSAAPSAAAAAEAHARYGSKPASRRPSTRPAASHAPPALSGPQLVLQSGVSSTANRLLQTARLLSARSQASARSYKPETAVCSQHTGRWNKSDLQEEDAELHAELHAILPAWFNHFTSTLFELGLRHNVTSGSLRGLWSAAQSAWQRAVQGRMAEESRNISSKESSTISHNDSFYSQRAASGNAISGLRGRGQAAPQPRGVSQGSVVSRVRSANGADNIAALAAHTSAWPFGSAGSSGSGASPTQLPALPPGRGSSVASSNRVLSSDTSNPGRRRASSIASSSHDGHSTSAGGTATNLNGESSPPTEHTPPASDARTSNSHTALSPWASSPSMSRAHSVGAVASGAGTTTPVRRGSVELAPIDSSGELEASRRSTLGDSLEMARHSLRRAVTDISPGAACEEEEDVPPSVLRGAAMSGNSAGSRGHVQRTGSGKILSTVKLAPLKPGAKSFRQDSLLLSPSTGGSTSMLGGGDPSLLSFTSSRQLSSIAQSSHNSALGALVEERACIDLQDSLLADEPGVTTQFTFDEATANVSLTEDADTANAPVQAETFGTEASTDSACTAENAASLAHRETTISVTGATSGIAQSSGREQAAPIVTLVPRDMLQGGSSAPPASQAPSSLESSQASSGALSSNASREGGHTTSLPPCVDETDDADIPFTAQASSPGHGRLFASLGFRGAGAPGGRGAGAPGGRGAGAPGGRGAGAPGGRGAGAPGGRRSSVGTPGDGLHTELGLAASDVQSARSVDGAEQAGEGSHCDGVVAAACLTETEGNDPGQTHDGGYSHGVQASSGNMDSPSGSSRGTPVSESSPVHGGRDPSGGRSGSDQGSGRPVSAAADASASMSSGAGATQAVVGASCERSLGGSSGSSGSSGYALGMMVSSATTDCTHGTPRVRPGSNLEIPQVPAHVLTFPEGSAGRQMVVALPLGSSLLPGGDGCETPPAGAWARVPSANSQPSDSLPDDVGETRAAAERVLSQPQLAAASLAPEASFGTVNLDAATNFRSPSETPIIDTTKDYRNSTPPTGMFHMQPAGRDVTPEYGGRGQGYSRELDLLVPVQEASGGDKKLTPKAGRMRRRSAQDGFSPALVLSTSPSLGSDDESADAVDGSHLRPGVLTNEDDAGCDFVASRTDMGNTPKSSDKARAGGFARPPYVHTVAKAASAKGSPGVPRPFKQSKQGATGSSFRGDFGRGPTPLAKGAHSHSFTPQGRSTRRPSLESTGAARALEAPPTPYHSEHGSSTPSAAAVGGHPMRGGLPRASLSSSSNTILSRPSSQSSIRTDATPFLGIPAVRAEERHAVPLAPASIKYANDQDAELKRADSMYDKDGNSGIHVVSEEETLGMTGAAAAGSASFDSAGIALRSALQERIHRDMADAKRINENSSSSSDTEAQQVSLEQVQGGTVPDSAPRLLDLGQLAASLADYGAGSQSTVGRVRLGGFN